MNERPVLRVAVVGCGALARLMHLPHIKANPFLRLVATCDADAAVAAECRDTFGAERALTDWRPLIDADDVDLIVLATHTNLRADLIVPALQAGKPVYTEKPLAADKADMLRILRASRQSGTPLCVGHNRRSSPAVLELKRLLDKARSGSAEITRPSIDRDNERAPLPEQSQTMILMRINDDVRSWKDWIFWDEQGIMFAEMVHFIDLALWLHTSQPVRVFAEGSARGNFTMNLRFADGSVANFHHTFVGNFDYPKELIEVTTANVSLALEQHIEVRQCGLADEPLRRSFPLAPDSAWAQSGDLGTYFDQLETETKRARQEGRPPRWINVVKGHAEHLDRFARHITLGEANPCPLQTAIPVNRIAMKFLESVRTGLPIAIGPEDWHIPGGIPPTDGH